MDLTALTLDELERHFTANGDTINARLVRRCIDEVAAARNSGCAECDECDGQYDVGYEAGYQAGVADRAHGSDRG